MKNLLLLLIAAVPALTTSAQLVVVSVRTVQTAAFDTKITFEIPEGAAQEVVIRQIGPSLSQFGIPNALTDPAIELSKNGRVIAANDNWGDNDAGAISEAFFRKGAFPFANGSRDAALLLTLDPGEYSLRSFSATGSGNGSTLHEIYAGPAGLQSFGITNVSPTNSPNPGFLLGFVSMSGSYLVRALGPSLGDSGASDPFLSIRNNMGADVGLNNNWGSSPDAAEIAAATSMLGLPALAAGSKDAALLLGAATPGVYTAIADDFGAPGLSSLEIYDLSYANAGTPVPEPSTYGLFAIAATGLLVLCGKRRTISK